MQQTRQQMLTYVFCLAVMQLLCTAQGDGAPAALVTCLKAGDQSQLTTYQDFVNGKPTRLSLRGDWWSAKKSPLDLSIVTGLTVSRLDQLEAQCKAWRGPLTAAVYLVVQVPPGTPDLDSAGVIAVAEARKDMAELHKRLEAMGDNSCALNMMLLLETVSDRAMKWMLPINVLRNYALLAARTRLVAMVDVDLLPSVGLAKWLVEPGNMNWLKVECSQKKIFVMPAFETATNPSMTAAHQIANEAAKQDKKGLLRMVEAGKVWQFALKIFKEGHNCTDYPLWFATNKAYGPQGWTKDYEPWFIIDRTLTPFYDSVFRGYGWNKVTQVTNVHHQGFQFMVHPTGFLVHRQHSYSKAGNIYQESKTKYEQTLKVDKAKARADTSLAATTHKFRDRVLEQLSKGTYSPVLDDGMTKCLAGLPWWNQGGSMSLATAQLVHGPAPKPAEDALVQQRRRRRRARRRRQLEQPPRKLIAQPAGTTAKKQQEPQQRKQEQKKQPEDKKQ